MRTGRGTGRLCGAAFFIATWLLGSLAIAAAPTAEECVGAAGFDFSLPSTEGRLAQYADDYYGRHHLVITFFPAAFTPV